jgi:hypothetical protein
VPSQPPKFGSPREICSIDQRRVATRSTSYTNYYVKYLAESLVWPGCLHGPPVVTSGGYERVSRLTRML